MRNLTLSARKAWKVISRAFLLLFKRKRAVQVFSFRYSRRYLFQQSYLTIECRCKNVLWLSIHGYGVFTNPDIVLNISNLKHQQLQLIVQGLFSKRAFYLEVKPEQALQTKTFKTAITEWHLPSSLTKEIQMLHKNISIPHKPIVCLPAMEIKADTIVFLPSVFNQADYI